MTTDNNFIIGIEKLDDGQYYLVFHPSDTRLSYDGHTWAMLVISYCNAENIAIGDVTHDPESDMYSAISLNVGQLESIKTAIEVLMSNSNLCETLASQFKELDEGYEEGDLTTEEFLEWMDEAGYDMTKPRTFIFDLDAFENMEQAETVKNEIEKKGYNVKAELLEDDIYFSIKISLKPSLALISEIELYLQSVALRHGIKYIGFGV